MIALRNRDATSLARARDLVRACTSRWPETGVVHAVTYRNNPEETPLAVDQEARTFTGPPLAESIESAADNRLVTVQHRRSRMPFALASTHGFALGRSVTSRAWGISDDLFFVLVWFDTGRLEAGYVEEAAENLRIEIDGFMRDGMSLQSLCGRWGWHHPDIDHTPYEQACGITKPVTVGREWLSSYVRGITNDSLWLGPELVARLESIDRVADIADVEPRGEGVRIRCRSETSLRGLEEAIEPLLPRPLLLPHP